MVRCVKCRARKVACPFTIRDWGIVEWPTILESPENKARRVANAEGKRKKVAAPPLEKAASEGSAVARPTRQKKVRARLEETVARSDSLSRTPEVPIPAPSVPSFQPGWQGGSAFSFPKGRSEHVFFEDLGPFDALLRDPARTRMGMSEAIARLNAISASETSSFATLSSLVTARRGLIDHLIADLIQEVGRGNRGRDEAPPVASGSGTRHGDVEGEKAGEDGGH